MGLRSVLARIVPLLIKLLALLPPRVLPRLARGMGWLLLRLPNRERRNAEVNLALAFPQLDPPARRRLLAATLRDNLLSLLEMPRAWNRGAEYWRARVEFTALGQELMALLQRGKGVIIAAPHLGNWEVGVHMLAMHGPITILYRPPRQTFLEQILLRGRSQGGGRLVPTTATGVRELRKALGRGEMIAILPDQQPKAGGRSGAVFAPFFGRPALTMTLVHRLARASGAPVLLAYAARCEDMLTFVGEGHELPAEVGGEDPQRAATVLNAAIEAAVRRHPSQYQWTYRRFETSPDGQPSPYKRTADS